MQSGPSKTVLIYSIYETEFIKKQSKMFKRDLRQKSNETASIEYGPGIQYLLNTVQSGDNHLTIFNISEKRFKIDCYILILIPRYHRYFTL